MTARVRDFAPATKVRSAEVLICSALRKVPEMVRDGLSVEQVADYIFVVSSFAEDLYAEAGAS